MSSIAISLSPEQAETIHRAVQSGAYASDSEVLREALQLWEQRETFRRDEMQRLKRAYDEGIASGPGREVSADDLLAEFKTKAGVNG